MSGGRILAVVVAVLIGVGAAYGFHQIRSGSPTTAVNTSSSPTPGATDTSSPSASPSASASASPSPAASASPSAAPTTAPTTHPTTAPTTAPTPGPAAYPAQIKAGSSYAYSGKGGTTAFASDSRDVVSSACAGINDTTQTVLANYQIYSFVSFVLPDKRIIASGWVRTDSGRQAFASIQDASGPGTNSAYYTAAVSAGSHSFCVTHASGGWNATVDGANINTALLVDSASSSSGGSVQFHTSIAQVSTSAPAVSAQGPRDPGLPRHHGGRQRPTRLRGVNANF